MAYGIHQPPGNPFPPSELTSDAILNIGLMFGHIILLLVIIVLMIHYSTKPRRYITIIVIYLFSLVIGFESFLHIHTPFSPMIEIFFIVFNTSLFIQTAIDYYTLDKRKKGIR